MISKYRAVKKSVHPSDPPGCPLWQACTILTISLLIWVAISFNSGIIIIFKKILPKLNESSWISMETGKNSGNIVLN